MAIPEWYSQLIAGGGLGTTTGSKVTDNLTLQQLLELQAAGIPLVNPNSVKDPRYSAIQEGGQTTYDSMGQQSQGYSDLFGDVGLDPIFGANGLDGYTLRLSNLGDTGEASRSNIALNADGTIRDAQSFDPGSGFWTNGFGRFIAAAGAGYGAGAMYNAANVAAPVAAGGTTGSTGSTVGGTAASTASAGGGGSGLTVGAAGQGLQAGANGGAILGTGGGSTVAGSTAGITAPAAAGGGVSGSTVAGTGGLLNKFASEAGGGGVDPYVTAPAEQGFFDQAGNWIANNPSKAGAIAGGVLGGISGSQDSTQATTSTYKPSDEYMAYANPALQSILQYGQGSAPAYTGPMTVEGSDYLGDAKGAYSNLSAAGNAEMQTVRDMIAQAGVGYDAAYNPFSDATNPYIDKAVEAATRGYVDNYNTVVAPKFSMGSSFGNAGLAGAEALERSNVGRQIGDISTGINYNAYNLAAQLSDNYAGRQDAAAQFKGSQLLSGASTLGQLGESAAGRSDAASQARAGGFLSIGNSGLQNAQNNMQSQQDMYKVGLDEMNRRIAALQNGLGTNLGGTTTQSSTTPGNTASGIIGGAIVGSQIGAGPTPKSTVAAPATQSIFAPPKKNSLFQSNYQGY